MNLLSTRRMQIMLRESANFECNQRMDMASHFVNCMTRGGSLGLWTIFNQWREWGGESERVAFPQAFASLSWSSLLDNNERVRRTNRLVSKNNFMLFASTIEEGVGDGIVRVANCNTKNHSINKEFVSWWNERCPLFCLFSKLDFY